VRWWWTMRVVSRWNRWKKCHSIIWLGESELERLVRGWRREAGSWLTHSSINAAVIALTFLAASYTLVWAQWTLYQIGLPVGKVTFEGACAGPCNVPPDECSASLQCLSLVQCIRRCDGWQDAAMQPFAKWLWTLVIKLLKYCAHIRWCTHESLLLFVNCIQSRRTTKKRKHFHKIRIHSTQSDSLPRAKITKRRPPERTVIVVNVRGGRAAYTLRPVYTGAKSTLPVFTGRVLGRSTLSVHGP